MNSAKYLGVFVLVFGIGLAGVYVQTNDAYSVLPTKMIEPMLYDEVKTEFENRAKLAPEDLQKIVYDVEFMRQERGFGIQVTIRVKPGVSEQALRKYRATTSSSVETKSLTRDEANAMAQSVALTIWADMQQMIERERLQRIAVYTPSASIPDALMSCLGQYGAELCGLEARRQTKK